MEMNMTRVAQAMRDNGFTVLELSTGKQACDELLSRIPQGAVVGVGGSVSVRETGVLEALAARGGKVLNHWTQPEEARARTWMECLSADVYLASANAITKEGHLVLVDGVGNRVGAVAHGPKEVFFVVSHSKVVDGGIHAAVARIKQTACPQNARRLGLKTPCAQAGICGGKACDNSMCRLTLSVDRVPQGRAMTVLFVEEALGY